MVSKVGNFQLGLSKRGAMMRYLLGLVISVIFLLIVNVDGRAQATPEAQAADSCALLKLPGGLEPEGTIKISRALNICDDLRKIFDRSRTAPKSLGFMLQQHVEEKALEPGDVDNLLQQPGGQAQLLRQLYNEVQKSREERNQLAEVLQDRVMVEAVNAKAISLASSSNRVRLQVQSVLAAEQAFQVETELQRYKNTKMLNAFLGTTVATVGTGLQLNSSLHVQHVGDYLGVVGGGLTAFFNICTADWNVPDTQTYNSLLFRAFATDNAGTRIPVTVWDSLDESTKNAVKAVDPHPGSTDLAPLHLSCHWGQGRSEKTPSDLTARIKALKLLDDDLTKVNARATELSEKLSLQ
jgi:hypothetical protein